LPVRRTEIQSLPESPVPGDILDRSQTLTSALSEMVERFPDFECLTFYDRHGGEERLSLAKFWRRAGELCAVFRARGLRRGGCGMLILPTGAELVSAYFGVLLAGSRAALVAKPAHRVADPRVYARHVGAILANAEADILYCDEEVARLFRDDATALGRARLVTPEAAGVDDNDGPSLSLRASDIATIQYSSGSTGAPKGVLLSHGAILDNLRAIRAALALRAGDVSVNWIPLYHDMGLIDGFLLPLLCGCATVLIPTMDFMRDPSLWLWAIHRYRGTLSWAPNFAYSLCAGRIPDRELEGLDLSSWRIAVSAAEPVLAGTVRAFAERFASHGFGASAMTPAYGLAEDVTIVTAHPLEEPPRIESVARSALATHDLADASEGVGVECVSCGPPLPGYELEIRDAEHRVLPERRVGTIWVRSGALFSGYQGDDDATRRALVDGWLDTGDRGYLAGGHLYFVSREKDLIVIGGDKFAPQDIETAINEVPGVRQGCAVAFGVLNPGRGTEEVAAVVETREVDPEALDALALAIRAQVTRATGLGLRHLRLVPAGGIEKTTSGKLARGATRRRYAADFAATD
jgi:acyl-CoA synthetase (AMP-forming)/AMP-acid ligase II